MNASKMGIVVVLFALSPVLAIAQDEVLQYVGSPFTSLTITGNIANALATNAPPENTGQIVLGAPLGDDLNDAVVTPLSWSFNGTTSLGGFYLDSETHEGSISFTVSTNAQGNLTAWSIDASGNDFGSTNSPSSAMVSITNGGDSFSAELTGLACTPPPGGLTQCFSVNESNAAPGSWKTETVPVPEVDATSAYAALALLLGGLAVLHGRRPRNPAIR